jgi:CheY-like chemotaxis protein
MLLDVGMPVLDGLDTAKILKNKMITNQISYFPIIACTSYVSEEDK